jgi:WD40 repeat protein
MIQAPRTLIIGESLTMADRIEQQLGNYRLVRLIGVGSFAEVYIGEHVYLSTLAAIKVLHLRLASANQEVFLRESRTVASLSHPHIVRILDYGVNEKTPFLVMDYAPNGTLRQRYPSGTILPLTLIVSYVKQIASALQFAHDKKLIHRDIKPENLLLGSNNEVLLSDFGTASFVQSTHLQNAGELIGTIAYMAPEQFSGEAYFTSDQYALGIITYEWLTGERPFGGSPIEIASQHLFASPPPLCQKNLSIKPEVEEVVMMALAKDPHERFKRTIAFANALEQASGVGVDLLPALNIADSLRGASLTFAPPAIKSEGIILSTLSTLDGVMLTSPSLASDRIIPTPLTASAADEAVNKPETALSQQQFQSKPRLSRRTVIGGLIGITGLVAVGGVAIAWEIFQMPVVTYRGHSGPVYTAAWSPDGRLIVSGGADHTAQVWEAATGNHLLTYKGHTFSVNSLMWSPINAWQIVSASADKTVAIWKASTGERIRTYTGHTDNVRTVAWSPNEQWICSGGDDKTVQVWEAATGKRFLTYKGHSELVWSAAWSPNGNYIVSTGVDATVQVWEAFTGKQLLIYTGHLKPVTIAAWSPDGRLIASGSEDTTVQVWEISTGKRIYTYRGHISTVNSLSWSPDGTRIASGSGDATVQVWEVANSQLIHTYDDHSDAIAQTALWSPTGRNIVSARSSGIVQVWNAP